MSGGYAEHLYQQNSEEREKKRERKNRKAICQVKLNGENVGCGCLVYDPLVHNPELSKYCIITSSNVVSNENVAAGYEYHVLFERASSSRNPRDIALNDITKKTIFLGSGVVLMFIDSTSPQLHHGCGILRRKCSILKHLPQVSSPSNDRKQFCYAGSKRYTPVETNGLYALKLEQDESIPPGSVLLEGVGRNINAVGIINSNIIQTADDEQVVISPVWLRSSLQGLLGEC